MATVRTPAARPQAILIAGPTATGKSAAAMEIARGLGGTVINADSMQVYRELSVLTARPRATADAEVPHRLYGTVPAWEAYSVGRWLEDAAGAINEARQAGRVPILVGGTGLYFKALTQGLAPVPYIPLELRMYWREQSEKHGSRSLHAALIARDPVLAERLPPTDTQRLVRALEVFDATGISLAEWQGATAPPILAPERALRILIAPERAVIYAAIDARFDRMLAQGALGEARAFAQLDLDPGLPAMRAHGVRELIAYLDGGMSPEQAIVKAKTETRRYAKRQMTWARRFMADWEWVPDADAAVEAASAVFATP